MSAGVVLQNLVAGGCQGLVMPVDRAGGVVCSRPVARSLGELGSRSACRAASRFL
jgi:acyl-CoA synthetase (NDP forming)